MSHVTDISHSSQADVSSSDQLEVLAEPTRYAIYSAVAWGGAQTIREISQRLAMKPASLYRHIEQLCDAELLIAAGEIETSRRPAKVYRARRALRYVPENPEAVSALCKVVDRAAGHAAAGFRRSAENGQAVTTGRNRDTHMGVQSGWLSKQERQRANQLIDELRELLMQGERRAGAQLVQTAVFMWPHVEKTGD